MINDVKFSQRHGYLVEKAIQFDSIDAELRNRLWNLIDQELFRKHKYESTTSRSFIFPKISRLYDLFLKRTVDSIPFFFSDMKREVSDIFFRAQWFEVYDFVEFIAYEMSQPDDFRNICNDVLKEEKSAYRFIKHNIVPISSAVEKEAIESALSVSTGIVGISTHLEQALQLLADRHSPDYRNSIKESISAIEGLCRYLTGNNKETFTNTLSILERNGVLHGALKSSWSSLYGYISQTSRHAVKDASNPPTDVDAKYILVSCSAIVNFMIAKAVELGHLIPKS